MRQYRQPKGTNVPFTLHCAMSLNASGHPGKAQWQYALGDVQEGGVFEGGDDGGAPPPSQHGVN